MADLMRYKPAALDRVRPKPSLDDVRARYAPQTSGPHRIVLLFDATGSMAPYWDSVKRGISEIVGRLLSVAGGVAMKIVAYRDDCDGPRILEASDWCTTADALGDFIARVVCDGGGDAPEAVDRALGAALAEEHVSRAILIGDAPPHSYRDCRAEAQQLGQKGRPVYPIVIGQHAETIKSFAMIAELSGGKMISFTNLEELFELITLLAAHAAGPETLRRYETRYALTEGGKRLLLQLRA
jgi:hypothetical protein